MRTRPSMHHHSPLTRIELAMHQAITMKKSPLTTKIVPLIWWHIKIGPHFWFCNAAKENYNLWHHMFSLSFIAFMIHDMVHFLRNFSSLVHLPMHDNRIMARVGLSPKWEYITVIKKNLWWNPHPFLLFSFTILNFVSFVLRGTPLWFYFCGTCLSSLRT